MSNQSRGLPQNSFISALRAHLPHFAPRMVFDVGANVGQSIATFSEAFPTATIFAFEPISATYRTLVENTGHLPAVRAYRLALGRRNGVASMVRHRSSTASRVVNSPKDRENVEVVEMQSGDAFCARNAINHIDFLKIDTEGHDLEVLAGFQKLLADMSIDLLEAEVGMNRLNKRHVPFEWIKAFLEPMGYSLFHIHEETMDIAFSGRPTLRRINVVFVSERMAEANRKSKPPRSP